MIYVSYRIGDARAALIYAALKGRPDFDIAGGEALIPGSDLQEQLQACVLNSSVFVAVISPGWLRMMGLPASRPLAASNYAQVALELALREGIRIVPVLVGGAKMPASEQLPDGFRRLGSLQCVEVADGPAFTSGMDELVRTLREADLPTAKTHPAALDASERRAADSPPTHANSGLDELFESFREADLSRMSKSVALDPFAVGAAEQASPYPTLGSPDSPESTASPVAPSVPVPPASSSSHSSSDSSDPFSEVDGFSTFIRPPAYSPMPSPASFGRQATPLPPVPMSAAPSRSPGVLSTVLKGLRGLWSRKSPEESRAKPVLLAASAPRSCSPGATFTAALVAYVAEARASAIKKLADLGESGDRRVEDVAASAWRIGAPITVRLTGEGASVTPPAIAFDWNGRENLAAFSVRVEESARGAVALTFEIEVAGILVAFIPMRVAPGASSDAQRTARVESSLPGSAFASYSSQDAEPVTQRLSTLSRWAPGLDIFQDCLDLSPGEAFKPQLEKQIAGRDVFLLFWSRQAALSPWVRWEYTTALQCKGLPRILAMPLEDPAIAPPPPELAELHQRDRFMLAGYGLKKVREEIRKGP